MEAPSESKSRWCALREASNSVNYKKDPKIGKILKIIKIKKHTSGPFTNRSKYIFLSKEYPINCWHRSSLKRVLRSRFRWIPQKLIYKNKIIVIINNGFLTTRWSEQRTSECFLQHLPLLGCQQALLQRQLVIALRCLNEASLAVQNSRVKSLKIGSDFLLYPWLFNLVLEHECFLLHILL